MLGFVFVLLPAAIVSYLGNLAKIMDVAAWSEEGAHRLRRDMEIGMSNDAAYEQLRSLYEPVVVAANQHLSQLAAGRKFEWVEMPAEGGCERYAAIALQVGKEVCLGDLLGPIERINHFGLRMLADSRQRLMRTWRRLNDSSSHLEDELGDNYCLRQLRIEDNGGQGAIRLDVAVASYGEIMRSSDALINEFALFAYLCGPIGRRRRPSVRQKRVLEMSPRATLRCLPWRRRVHREHRGREHEIFLAPRNRAAGIGIAVVTAGRKEGATEVYLGIRSGKVGTYPATNHVVPAGMCNTYGTNYEVPGRGHRPPPDYLETVMRCEFLEEWAQATELESNKRREWAKLVNQAWGEQIEDLVTEPLRLTGVAFDLLNLRPEVCATISVDMHDGTLNWEFDQIGVHGPLEEMGRVRRTEIVQGGAAALRLAQLAEKDEVRVVAAVSSDRPKLPEQDGEDGLIPEDEYKAIQRKVPILCVDLLPLRPDGKAVGLIRRKTYQGGEGWCLIGGAVRRNEDLLAAIRRHLRANLGTDFVADLTQARPLTTVQYFSEPHLGEFYDPRKHAVALTYAAVCSGTPKLQREKEKEKEKEKEALDFRWFEFGQLPDVEFGFGQGRVVEAVLGKLGLRERRS